MGFWNTSSAPAENLLMFHPMPPVFIDATDQQSTSSKAQEESCYTLMGYLHFFLTFPSASAAGINKLILSATLLRQPKAETASLYLFKYVLLCFFFL